MSALRSALWINQGRTRRRRDPRHARPRRPRFHTGGIESDCGHEHTLGLRLLDRNRNGIEPTAYGRALVKRGLTIFDELKQGIEELEFLADPSVGSLRIGSTESVAAGMLPAIIERFWREHPGVCIDVAQTVISTLHYRELRERSIDLMIGRIPTPFVEDDLEAEIVYDDQVVVVAGRQSKWARLRRLKLADLDSEPSILRQRTMPGSLAGANSFVPARRDARSAPSFSLLHLPFKPCHCRYRMPDIRPAGYQWLPIKPPEPLVHALKKQNGRDAWKKSGSLDWDAWGGRWRPISAARVFG